ncbi:hypothetical protein ACWCV5_02385 [Streptomyces tubercidicus]
MLNRQDLAVVVIRDAVVGRVSCFVVPVDRVSQRLKATDAARSCGAHDRVSGVVDHDVHRPGLESPADHLVAVGRPGDVEDLGGQPVAVRLAQVLQSCGAADRGCDAVAAQVLPEQGLDTAPTAIAKQAGVGVGTLCAAYSAQHSTREQARRLIALLMDALTAHSPAD